MDFNYNKKGVDLNNTLYNAQLIADAFAKTLEENNCLLILTVGLHQEIATTIKDVEDLVDTVSDTNDVLEGVENESTPIEYILDNLASAIADSKQNCFTCNLKFPNLDFDMDLEGVLGKLRGQIDLYLNMFKINKLDMCQASYAMQDSCLPDILKLITLLLTAYVSIMALKKLTSISITSFIKGVLSMLLSKLIGSLKVTLSIGSTNIACLVDTLREIALSIPTQENIQTRLNATEQMALGLIDANGEQTDSQLLKNQTLDKLGKSLGDGNTLLNSADQFLIDAEKELNKTFDLISKVVDGAIKEVDTYIQSLLSFITHFECETARSGMDVEDALSTINNLIQVINLLSALAMSIAKKEARDAACKTNNKINELSKTEISDIQTKDILEDFNQKVTEIINSDENGLELLIHDVTKEDALPKLSLLDCSIDDFIEAHTISKIISVAKKQVAGEVKRFTSNGESQTYVFKKPSAGQMNQISNIVDLLYEPPLTEEEQETNENIVIDIKNPIGVGNISDTLADFINKRPEKVDLKCRSIDDVLDVLKNITR